MQSDGRWRLSRDGQEIVRNAHLVIATPRWEGTVDQQAGQRPPATSAAAPRPAPDGLALESTLRQPLSQAVWQFRQTVVATAAGWRMVYELRPQQTVDAGEVVLFLDLPIKLWSGTPIVLWPAGESRFPRQPPADRHFYAGPARLIGLGGGPAGQLTLRDTIAGCTFQDTREYQGDIYQLYVQLHSGGRLAAGSVLRLEFELRPADAQPIALPALRLTAADKLHIKQLNPDPPHVAQGSRWTLRADVTGTYRTPFDPQQMAVDAHFVTPSGRTIDVPAFFTQDYRRHNEDGYSLIEPQGPPGWEVRFTPVEAGAYRYWLTARDGSGEVRSADEPLPARRPRGQASSASAAATGTISSLTMAGRTSPWARTRPCATRAAGQARSQPTASTSSSAGLASWGRPAATTAGCGCARPAWASNGDRPACTASITPGSWTACWKQPSAMAST